MCWCLNSGAIQEAEGTCFWPHRVKTVPLVTKEMTVNLDKR